MSYSENLQKKIEKIRQVRKQRGWRGVVRQLWWKFSKLREKRKYQTWLRRFDALDGEDRRLIRRRIENFEHKPLISVVLPVYNVEEKWLRLCLDSVSRQLYENWELCIADDCSPAPHVRRVLEEYAAKDRRVKVIFRQANGHISAASNSALELAAGEFVVLLDHDDELSEHALYFVAEELNRFPQTAMIYSDEDMIDEHGRRYAPKFKPDWSRDFFYSLNLITHLSAYRTGLLRKIGGFRVGAEGSQDYDLALRVTESIPAEQIRHIPQILYHWRAIQGSVALSGDEKPYAHERAREAIRAHLERKEKHARISRGVYNLHRVSYDLPPDAPPVAVLTLNTGEKFLKDILTNTDYRNFELLVGANAGEIPRLPPEEAQKLKPVDVSAGKNPAERFNDLVKKSTGEFLVFLDGEFEPNSPEWLQEIVSFAAQAEIGAAGAKILFRDGVIRNGGVILGIDQTIGFAHRNVPNDDSGSFMRAMVIGNFSAVSGVFAVRRRLFEELSGFDEENFPNGLFDVDFCLRLGALKYRVVFTPYAELKQLTDSATEKVLSAASSVEVLNFKKKWQREIAADKFYNPNLSLNDAKFRLAFPPRIKKPWLE